MKLLSAISLTIVLLGTALSFAPAPAHALDDYTVLAPLPYTTDCGDYGGNNTGESSDQCKTNLKTYLPGAFKLAMGIAAALSFIMISYGGFLYMTAEAVGQKSGAKDHIENAIAGLLLVIGAWAILNTINPQILNFNLDLQRPDVKAVAGTVVPGQPMTPEQITQSNQVKDLLAAPPYNVSVNNGPCADGSTRGCTNLNGLPSNAVTGLGTLGMKCGAGCIMVTGGTEGGHATHGNGAAIVDLAPTQGLNSLLGAPSPTEGQVVIKTITVDGRGPVTATYTYETTGGNANGTATGNHWHVKFN